MSALTDTLQAVEIEGYQIPESTPAPSKDGRSFPYLLLLMTRRRSFPTERSPRMPCTFKPRTLVEPSLPMETLHLQQRNSCTIALTPPDAFARLDCQSALYQYKPASATAPGWGQRLGLIFGALRGSWYRRLQTVTQGQANALLARMRSPSTSRKMLVGLLLLFRATYSNRRPCFP